MNDWGGVESNSGKDPLEICWGVFSPTDVLLWCTRNATSRATKNYTSNFSLDLMPETKGEDRLDQKSVSVSVVQKSLCIIYVYIFCWTKTIQMILNTNITKGLFTSPIKIEFCSHSHSCLRNAENFFKFCTTSTWAQGWSDFVAQRSKVTVTMCLSCSLMSQDHLNEIASKFRQTSLTWWWTN